MAQTKNKRDMTRANDNNKLKTLKGLRTCKVVLHNIALDKDLVQRYQLHLSEKRTEKLEHSSSCINTSKGSSNVRIKKENIWEDSTQDKTFRRRGRPKKLTQWKNEECKNVNEFLDDVSLSVYRQNRKLIQPGFIAQKKQLKHDNSDKSFLLSKSCDETSTISSCSYAETKTVPLNNRKHINKKTKGQKAKWTRGGKKPKFIKSDTNMTSMQVSSNSDNYLDEKNLNTTDNVKMQEISETIKKCTNMIRNSYSVSNGKVCNLKMEQCIKNQNTKFSDIIDTDVGSKISETSDDTETDLIKPKDASFSVKNLFAVYNKMYGSQDQETTAKTKLSKETTSSVIDSTVQTTNVSESFTLSHICPTSKPNHVTKKSSNFLTTKIEKQCANNARTTKKNLPKITEDHILPKGTIKIVKVSSDDSLQSSASEQNRSSNTNSSMKQISHIDTLEFTNVLKEKKYHTSEIDTSIDILKVSKSTSALNNNINSQNKNTDNNEFHSTRIDRENINSLIEIKNNIHNNVNVSDVDSISTEIYEKCTLNCQKQLNRLHNGEENILQGDKSNKINSVENILNKNTSNLVDESESCNVNSSLIFAKNEATKQNRKRIAEETALKLENKKKRLILNRTVWLQNNETHDKSLNNQESNNLPNTIVTVESNISEKDVSRQKTDLREHLNKKRLKFPELSKLETEINNKNSVESKQTILNDKNDRTTPTKATKKKEFHRPLFFDDKEPNLNKTLNKEKDIQTIPINNNHTERADSTLQNIEETQHLSQKTETEKSGDHENNNIQECTNSKSDDKNDDNDDGDCISLFAESMDMTFYENSFEKEPNKDSKNKSIKSLHSDEPYIMTTSSFNKYVKQNATEFNKEYEQCVKDSVEKLNRADETKREFNNQSRQTMRTNCVSETRIASKVIPETKNVEIPKCQLLKKNTLRNFIHGYCFTRLKKGFCNFTQCRYKHELSDLFKVIYLEDDKTIVNILQEALYFGYNFFCKTLYVTVLRKLTTNQILVVYQMFHSDIHVNEEFTHSIKRDIIRDIIKELLNRRLSLQTIVNYLLEYITTNDPNNLVNILTCIEQYIKRGEYWSTVKNLIMRLPPDNLKHVVQKILLDCKESKSIDVEDIYDNLISKVPHIILISMVDKGLLEHFERLRNEKTKNNSGPTIQNFGENLWETIASPDGSVNLSQTESPRHDDTFINKSTNEIKNAAEMNGEFYTLQPIDFDLPETRSVHRNSTHLWKFYVDLDRFKKGLLHNDYDYVIKILRKYAEKEDDKQENTFFVRACCTILRTEVKRSDQHLKNIIRRTDKNIICTSRHKWYVKSTINDESVRNKIIHILLDSFCNQFVEQAFFLFKFLLKDQCSQYYPIDLSSYVDKLIMLSLSKKDANLITEMANLILKYTFMLSTATCRALISTLIHMDENLARQIYNYAEVIGIYPAVKLWPVTCIIINTNLTEEEIYLTFLQLLKNLIINFGHAIEFAKPHQIKVYLILEIKSINEQSYYAELQNHNNKAITDTKALIRNVLKKRFDPPILLMPVNSKSRICKLQSKSVINYLKTEHCN
ncbi:PREDICTED: protein PFC0760c-like isoform X2 [Wasmannia auropunctata]|uniref:protein PFC0760c-like isoform X2 n=1 Tax=Wasmannia auropunctata TaxID=64793 RepID=UPI0005EEFBDB|nr:PREDICTED: protein PFC0760c-like isoform X2 [Wasmannia auropunctata]